MTYKITKVSEQPPKEWAGPHGLVYYIKVMVEGHEKPLEVGKKRPDALKVGDVLTGNIIESDHETDKFKAESTFGGGGDDPRIEKLEERVRLLELAVHTNLPFADKEEISVDEIDF